MIFDRDPYLMPFKKAITARYQRVILARDTFAGCGSQLKSVVNNHIYYGIHKEKEEGTGKWMRVFREWAPNATNIWVIGDFNGWKKSAEWKMNRVTNTGD